MATQEKSEVETVEHVLERMSVSNERYDGTVVLSLSMLTEKQQRELRYSRLKQPDVTEFV